MGSALAIERLLANFCAARVSHTHAHARTHAHNAPARAPSDQCLREQLKFGSFFLSRSRSGSGSLPLAKRTQLARGREREGRAAQQADQHQALPWRKVAPVRRNSSARVSHCIAFAFAFAAAAAAAKVECARLQCNFNEQRQLLGRAARKLGPARHNRRRGISIRTERLLIKICRPRAPTGGLAPPPPPPPPRGPPPPMASATLFARLVTVRLSVGPAGVVVAAALRCTAWGGAAGRSQLGGAAGLQRERLSV